MDREFRMVNNEGLIDIRATAINQPKDKFGRFKYPDVWLAALTETEARDIYEQLGKLLK